MNPYEFLRRQHQADLADYRSQLARLSRQPSYLTINGHPVDITAGARHGIDACRSAIALVARMEAQAAA